MPRLVVVFALLLLLAACRSSAPRDEFESLVSEFVYESLSRSPVTATQSGYHWHRGVPLDELLDDYSAPAIQQTLAYYRGFQQRLDREVDVSRLDAQQRADLEIIRNQIGLALLELETIQDYRHNPTRYVELIGSALFHPLSVDYAPLAKRYRHIIARLEKVPALIGQARRNLDRVPPIWAKVALMENEGNIGLIDVELRKRVPPDLKAAFDRAAAAALAALRDFNTHLAGPLSAQSGDWRLGKDQYARKFAFVLGLNSTPEQVLADAEQHLESIREEMYRLALPMHERFFPGRRDRSDRNRVIRQTLDRIAARRSTPQSYFADARRDLEEARSFVRAKNLVALPARDNLQVIETPEFMRGIYAVGGFNPAPPLEPALGAFYWLTPIPTDWPRERIDSKLREYNYYGLKLLTIHEAIPGHYLQFEYANDLQPPARRILRALFGNGAYVEGWAVYATEMMLEEGFLNHDPALRLVFLKQQLRMVANAILDVRLQTMNMTGEDAVRLMIEQTFQEQEEATAKLQRAQLSSAQLPTYFAGWRAWRQLRDRIRSRQGASFSLARFHEDALRQSAVPMTALEALLLALAAKAPA